MIITKPHWFVRDNLVDPVVKSGVLADGKTFSYTLANGFTYHLNEAAQAYIQRLGFTIRLSTALQALDQPHLEAPIDDQG